MIIPATRPRATPEKVRSVLHDSLRAEDGINLDAILRDCKVFVLANRGYYLQTMGDPTRNDFGLFDDAAWIITPDEIVAFNWNVDPSRAGWNPSLGKPYANLCAGLWPFIKGQHKNQGAAWRQPYAEQAEHVGLGQYFIDGRKDGEFEVLRSVPEKKISFVDEGYHAINIHWATNSGTSSWGCQTTVPAQWVQFLKLSYELTTKYKQTWLPYLLTEKQF